MKTINPSAPAQVNYRILELIEQLVSVVPKGTALGLSDLADAMFSGYFIESGGAVTPAIWGDSPMGNKRAIWGHLVNKSLK